MYIYIPALKLIWLHSPRETLPEAGPSFRGTSLIRNSASLGAAWQPMAPTSPESSQMYIGVWRKAGHSQSPQPAYLSRLSELGPRAYGHVTHEIPPRPIRQTLNS